MMGHLDGMLEPIISYEDFVKEFEKTSDGSECAGLSLVLILWG